MSAPGLNGPERRSRPRPLFTQLRTYAAHAARMRWRWCGWWSDWWRKGSGHRDVIAAPPGEGKNFDLGPTILKSGAGDGRACL